MVLKMKRVCSRVGAHYRAVQGIGSQTSSWNTTPALWPLQSRGLNISHSDRAYEILQACKGKPEGSYPGYLPRLMRKHGSLLRIELLSVHRVASSEKIQHGEQCFGNFTVLKGEISKMLHAWKFPYFVKKLENNLHCGRRIDSSAS